MSVYTYVSCTYREGLVVCLFCMHALGNVFGMTCCLVYVHMNSHILYMYVSYRKGRVFIYFVCTLWGIFMYNMACFIMYVYTNSPHRCLYGLNFGWVNARSYIYQVYRIIYMIWCI